MQGMTWTSFGMIWATLILLSFGQICIKLGLGNERIPTGGNPVTTIANILKTMMRPKVILGFSFYVVGTVIWIYVLSRVPLSIAFPFFSMSYFLVVILSATILKEHVIWRYAIVGLVLISIGVGFIGSASPSKSEKAAGAHAQTSVRGEVAGHE